MQGSMMRIETWGALNVRITGGLDREGGGDGPAVVLLHGFGAPGDDLVGLWPALDVDPSVRFVFPEAPLSLAEFGPEARAWWRIDMERMQRAVDSGEQRDRSAEIPNGMAEAHAQLQETLDVLQRELGVPEGKLLLGGFSQGAMLSTDVALTSERPLAGLALMSGTLLAEPVWTAGMSARNSLPILQSHGAQDPLLPLSAAERLRGLLTDAGCTVEWVPFRGGHEIPMPVLQALSGFIGRCL